MANYKHENKQIRKSVAESETRFSISLPKNWFNSSSVLFVSDSTQHMRFVFFGF